MANQFLEIPDSFWGLFRSKNRQIYIDALLKINEEYQYSNYFLSREICIQALSDHFARQKVTMEQDELEDDFDVLEPLATRVLNWLLRTGWLRKVDDYNTMTVNIVIPDYARTRTIPRCISRTFMPFYLHSKMIRGPIFPC